MHTCFRSLFRLMENFQTKWPMPLFTKTASISGPRETLAEIITSIRQDIKWPSQDLHILAQSGWKAMLSHMSSILVENPSDECVDLERQIESNEQWEIRRLKVVNEIKTISAVLESCLLKSRGVETVGKNSKDTLELSAETCVAKKFIARLNKVCILTDEVLLLLQSFAHPAEGVSWSSEDGNDDFKEASADEAQEEIPV